MNKEFYQLYKNVKYHWCSDCDGECHYCCVKDILNQIEEYNSKITFTVEYEFEENLMECVNGNKFVQVGMDKKGGKTLVSLDEKMFSY